MSSPFAAWDRATIEAAVTSAVNAAWSANKQFYEGDHWQEGDGWIGPHPGPNESGATEVMGEIADAFTSRNVVAEIVERHVAGVVGRDVSWSFVPRRPLKQGEDPTTAEQEAIDEIEGILTLWWNRRKMRGTLHKAVANLLLAQRAPLRLYVPPGYLVEQVPEGAEKPVTVLRASDVAGALAQIYVDTPDPDHAAVYTDPDTMLDAGVVKATEQAGSPTGPTRTIIEMSYLDAPVSMLDNSDADTVIHVERDTASVAEARLAMRGHILCWQMERSLLITPQVQQLQRALNLALSMMPRNVVTGGFLERVLINAQMPGTYDPATKKFTPTPHKVGAGVTTYVQGVQQTDANGQPVLSTPQVMWREPVSVDSSVAAVEALYHAMLAEADQEHVIIATQPTPSGKSREEARADYAASLLLTATAVEEAVRWVLDAVLAMAEAIAGQAGTYSSLIRADAFVRIDTGPVDPTAQAQVAANVDKGLMSQETGMEAIGIEDVDAEKARIEQAPGAGLDLLTRQAETMKALYDLGLDLSDCGELVEMDKQQLAILKRAQDRTPPPLTPPPTPPGFPPTNGGPMPQPANAGAGQ